jgi:hypothetical protein
VNPSRNGGAGRKLSPVCALPPIDSMGLLLASTPFNPFSEE